MKSPAARSPADLRVAFLGSQVWLDSCAPEAPVHGLTPGRFDVRESEAVMGALEAFQPQATVVFDPASAPAGMLTELPGATLGVLVDGIPQEDQLAGLEALDRLVSFDPALTGTPVGARDVWRAVPPPVSDTLYRPVRPLHGRPRAMSIGRSSARREEMLMPAKHHHDLLQVIHGVSGLRLLELLGSYDVGVYIAAERAGGFGQQVGVHLAAGQLLLSEPLTPAHGLERDIDYLQLDSPQGLVWLLDRLGRFPEMYQRIRVRGRMKAEQYRASRLFARLGQDLLSDVSAFGRSRGE